MLAGFFFGGNHSLRVLLLDVRLGLLEPVSCQAAELGSGPRYRQLVKHIVDMCEGMGAKVVAEGIETEGELMTLLQIGIPYGQGYLFSRPERREELEARLENLGEQLRGDVGGVVDDPGVEHDPVALEHVTAPRELAQRGHLALVADQDPVKDPDQACPEQAELADLDGNGGVDLRDYADFQAAFTGNG